MAKTDLIAPIVVAVIGLLGSFASLLLSWHIQRRAREEAKVMAELQSKLTLQQAQWQHEQTLGLEKYKGTLTLNQEKYKGELNKEMEHFRTELARKQTVSNLTEKYSQPLLVAAYDLQYRLYALVEYPISRQALEKEQGLEDLKIFTCYLLAQYLALNYVLARRRDIYPTQKTKISKSCAT